MCFWILVLNVDEKFLVLCSNNILKLIKISYIILTLFLLWYLPEITIYILCLNNLTQQLLFCKAMELATSKVIHNHHDHLSLNSSKLIS